MALPIVALGLAVPGLGLVLAFGVGLAVYREDRRTRRALLLLGLAVTVVSLVLTVLASSGSTKLERGVPVIVHAP